MPERYPPEDPREWLNRAQSNLVLAGMQGDRIYLEDLCFNAQQAAEKAIKDLEKAKSRMASRKDTDMAKQMVQWALTRCHGKEANQVGAASGSGP